MNETTRTSSGISRREALQPIGAVVAGVALASPQIASADNNPGLIQRVMHLESRVRSGSVMLGQAVHLWACLDRKHDIMQDAGFCAGGGKLHAFLNGQQKVNGDWGWHHGIEAPFDPRDEEQVTRREWEVHDGGARVLRTFIEFAPALPANWIVRVMLSPWLLNAEEDIRLCYRLTAENVTNKGFTAEFVFWGDCRLHEVRAHYLAFGEPPRD